MNEKETEKKYHGILAIDKPVGCTSFDVIRKMKRIFGIKKIGHGGTLDKAASGVLPVLIGEATKLFDYLLIGEKEYIATVRFGSFTETDDAEGAVIQKFDFGFDKSAVLDCLPSFKGEIEQIPPRYSALKVDGKRSYQLARQNVDFKRKLRKVTVHEIEAEHFDPPKKEAVLRIRCSSGTYIRSLARDLGQMLGWGAHLTALRRTRSAGLLLKDCCQLEDFTLEKSKAFFIPFHRALSAYPELPLAVSSETLRQGKKLSFSYFQKSPEREGVYRVSEGKELVALIEFKRGNLKYLRVFDLV